MIKKWGLVEPWIHNSYELHGIPQLQVFASNHKNIISTIYSHKSIVVQSTYGQSQDLPFLQRDFGNLDPASSYNF